MLLQSKHTSSLGAYCLFVEILVHALSKHNYDVVQASKNKSSFLSHTIKQVLLGWGGGVAANLAHLGSPLGLGDTIPQLSIPPIPILPRSVSILGSLQFRYDT